MKANDVKSWIVNSLSATQYEQMHDQNTSDYAI